ncbi:MAG: hypothetical protein NVS4B9_27800 [Ktedonobacteraceae bacterium]
MVDPFNTKFTPGTIDDQIDQHLSAQDHEHDGTLSRSDHSGPSATRIVKTLQEHYVSAQDHGQALERVWERFSAQRAPLETVLRGASDTRISSVKQRVRAPGNPVRLRIPISDVPLRRSGLLAVVCLVLIVGSMAVLPRLIHHSNPALSGTSNITPTATTATIIGEQPAYGVLPGAGTAYLYKGISPIRAGQSQIIYSPVQFKAHTGKLVEVNTQGGGAKIWSYKGDLFSIPILVDDVLYVPGQGGLDVMRAGDHTLLWHQSILLTPYMVSNGTLYAFGQDGGLEALRVSDGVLLWHSQYKFAWIDNNIVYAIEGFDYINALRANDGRLLWRTRLVDSSVSVGGGVSSCMRPYRMAFVLWMARPACSSGVTSILTTIYSQCKTTLSMSWHTI